MAHQRDKEEPGGRFPFGRAIVRDVKKFQFKISFKSLSSPKKANKDQHSMERIGSFDPILTARQRMLREHLCEVTIPMRVPPPSRNALPPPPPKRSICSYSDHDARPIRELPAPRYPAKVKWLSHPPVSHRPALLPIFALGAASHLVSPKGCHPYGNTAFTGNNTDRTVCVPATIDRDKNEPSRFLGEGVSFKAKLIGILEVSEARGDRMCQEALTDLKMAIRAAGEHKQRITVNVSIDGLRLRDEKTGDCLYHHPVHKVSFIAQDMCDSRAFGYIFGSPDTGHRFFGIKTDKSASQVVVAMRDLFQAVFELKKKEIEVARQHLSQHQIRLGGSLFLESGSNSKSDQAGSKMRTIQEDSTKENESVVSSEKSGQHPSDVMADLLDLEFELSSIQRGINQMQKITPPDPFGPSTSKEDPFGSGPFGDSFTPDTMFPSSKTTKYTPIGILPPPPSVKDTSRYSDPFTIPPPAKYAHRRNVARAEHNGFEAVRPPPPLGAPFTIAPTIQQEKHWFDQETESLFDEGELFTPSMAAMTTTTTTNTTSTVLAITPKTDQELSENLSTQPNGNTQFDVFTELDPLGTGRSKPYVDRKDFFQELKNPPKKVLKDLVTEAPANEATGILFQAAFQTGSSNLRASDNVVLSGEVAAPVRDSVTTKSSAPITTTTTPSATTGTVIDVDPFAETDPFYKSDPFTDDDFSSEYDFPPLSESQDPFDTGFADFTMFGKGQNSDVTDTSKDAKRNSPLSQSDTSMHAPAAFHGPLRVSLPPESSCFEAFTTSMVRSDIMHGGTLTITRSKAQHFHKQTTLAGTVKLPSPKSMQRSNNRMVRQMTVDVCSGTSNPLHPSPTPPTPPTPPRSDSHSPSDQGIMEMVTFRNRNAVTPTPPIAVCFAIVGEGDSASRLSGSSAELAEIAPEPPPRPASNITAIQPPPLPPKRQHVSAMIKPPPRPPHTGKHIHYDYIENYKTSSSPTPQEDNGLKSPPIPVPARKPRFGDFNFGSVPHRPQRQLPVAKFDDNDYRPPFPLLPPPQKKSPASDPSKNSQVAKPHSSAATTIASLLQSAATATTTVAEEQPSKLQQTKSLDITLSQLTQTGLADLAATLGVSPGHLSNMTLQELTKCLSQLSNISQDDQAERESIKRDKYATLRESVDEDPMFKAEFETTELTDDVFQDPLYDKYEVFRELMVEENCKEVQKMTTTSTVTATTTTTTTTTTTATASTSIATTSVISTPIIARGDESRGSLQPVAEMGEEKATPKQQTEDRYAALREISLQEVVTEKDEVDTSSEREEAEVTTVDDAYDFLTLSRQPSESTDSPTLENATVREPQSIIETTILEEDVSALEVDNEEAAEDKIASPTGTKNIAPEPSEERVNASAPSEMEVAVQNSPAESKQKEEEAPSTGESWEKFDGSHFATDKAASEGQSEGAVSPWSSDGKESNKIPPVAWQEDRGSCRRRRPRRSTPWRDSEELEEGWDDRRGEDGGWNGRPWREDGWSDGESFYEEVPPVKDRGYREERRGRRRRVSPWKRGQRPSRDISPWECEGREEEEEQWNGSSKHWHERSMDEEEEEEEEEYEVSWKMRPKHRGSSWDDERRRRHVSRDVNGVDYEEGRKRRPSPWRADSDRRSSWESASWDEDDRFSQRDLSEQRWMREEEYRRRWEPETDSRGYAWNRKCPAGEGEYMWHDQTTRWKQDGPHRYCRDRSHESPWEEDFNEQGEEESPRYQGRKWNWPKRPSSASEVRRSTEKSSPGEHKARMMEKQQQQHSLPITGWTEQGEKMGNYSFTERRYREKCSGRPRSRESYFNSDQEYEHWPHQDGRVRRMDCYEQRAQTLQTRHRYKKAHDQRGYNQKSPFDDDFSMQKFDFNVENKSQSAESDVSDGAKKKSSLPANTSIKPSMPTDTYLRRKDSQHSEPETRPSEVVPNSPHDSHEDDMGKTRASRGSSHRQSPFEDDFTPTDTRMSNARFMSSISSDICDYPRSPFEDTRNGCRVENLVEESVCKNEIEQKNGKLNDDVFLPAETEQKLADFENNMFDGASEVVPSNKTSTECRRLDRKVLGSIRNSEEGNKVEKLPSTMKARMSNLMRVDSTSSLRKSESVNIFARENDPFDDDFFSGEVMISTIPHPGADLSNRMSDKPSSNNNSNEHFKWTKAFDSFNFEEEK